MNEFVRTINEYKRMCRSYIKCNSCPMYDWHREMGDKCLIEVKLYPEKAYGIIERWSKENPPETMEERFFRMFPNAPRKEDDKTPKYVCPRDLGWEYNAMFCPMAENAECEIRECTDCWSRPYIETGDGDNGEID